jgi:hypothetical protein
MVSGYPNTFPAARGDGEAPRRPAQSLRCGEGRGTLGKGTVQHEAVKRATPLIDLEQNTHRFDGLAGVVADRYHKRQILAQCGQ